MREYAQGDGHIDVLVRHRLRRRSQAMRPQRIVDVVRGRAIAAPLADGTFRQALVLNVQVGHRNSPWLGKEILFLLCFCYLVDINEREEAEQLPFRSVARFIRC
jgi:hypothetical protein